MVKSYVPDRGDLIWLDFDPQAGREQAGHRPALVVSPKSYNEKSGLALCCPITSKIKNYPFEIAVAIDKKTPSAILADQSRSLDWRVRHAKFIRKVEPKIMTKLQDMIALLIQ